MGISMNNCMSEIIGYKSQSFQTLGNELCLIMSRLKCNTAIKLC